MVLGEWLVLSKIPTPQGLVRHFMLAGVGVTMLERLQRPGCAC